MAELASLHGVAPVIESVSSTSDDTESGGSLAFAHIGFAAVLDDGTELAQSIIVRPVGETWKVVPPR